ANMDIEKFNTLLPKEQFDFLRGILKNHLGEVDLYREVALIRAYLNYDLFKSETIQIESMLASASEVQVNQEGLQDRALLADFAYTDLERDEKGAYAMAENTPKDFSRVVDYNRLTLKETDPANQSFQEKVMQSWLANTSEVQFAQIPPIRYELRSGRVHITDPRIPNEIKQQLPVLALSDIVKQGSMLADLGSDTHIMGQSIDIQLQSSMTFKILKFFSILFSEQSAQQKADKRQTLKDIQSTHTILGNVSDESTGFAANIVEDKKTGDITIAIRGTDDALDVFFSDFQIGLGHLGVKQFVPGQIGSLKQFLRVLETQYGEKLKGKNITIVGHSLGGALSETVDTLDTGLNITACYNFNGPGIMEIPGVTVREGDGRRSIKVKNTDSIANLGTQSAHHTIPIDGTEHGVRDMRAGIQSMKPDKDGNMLVLNTARFKGITP
ncbi:MAG: DUF2974 domain-containing protein, partial [Candidatus Gracilibacteria bacterium]|nr:DUF2974 domain-containing protein [Candidatus Gracilibacteria bacterium]